MQLFYAYSVFVVRYLANENSNKNVGESNYSTNKSLKYFISLVYVSDKGRIFIVKTYNRRENNTIVLDSFR